MIQLDKSKFDSTNFVGNANDLGTIPVDKFTLWMCPHPANLNPPSFEYPYDRLLRFSGFIPDEGMYKPSSKAKEHENDPVIMVIKNGQASGLTVGRLNSIRSFTRYYLEKDENGQMSREVAVLPRNSKSRLPDFYSNSFLFDIVYRTSTHVIAFSILASFSR